MNVRRWLAGAVSAATVTAGFATAPVALAAPAALAATPSAGRGPVVMPFFGGKHPMAQTPGSTYYSGTWGGYGAVANRGAQLRYAAADFTVTSPSCAGGPDGSFAQLAALGGITSPAELAGVVETCRNNALILQGFYQIEGTDSFSAVTVSAGDAIQASVYYDAAIASYTFTVLDVTTAEPVVNATVACPAGDVCANGSAEAVTAMTFSHGQPEPLPLYWEENFTGGAVTSFDGTRGNFGANQLWRTGRFGLGLGENDAYTDPLIGGGAFRTDWAESPGFTPTAPAAAAAVHPVRHMFAAAPSPAGGSPLARRPDAASGHDWAGWIAQGHQGVRLRYSAIAFNAPSLNCAATPDGSVVQGTAVNGVTGPILMVGITETCHADGTYSIAAFYQNGTSGAEITGIPPGDGMFADLYYDARTKLYGFTLTDDTGPIFYDVTVPCPSGSTCEDNTAEAITGLAASSAGTGAAPLADYGMANFTYASITSSDGTKGDYTRNKLWNPGQLAIGGSGPGATASALAGGAAFSTTWHASS